MTMGGQNSQLVRKTEGGFSLLRRLFKQTHICTLGQLLVRVTCCFATFRVSLTCPLTCECLVLATQSFSMTSPFLHR